MDIKKIAKEIEKQLGSSPIGKNQTHTKKILAELLANFSDEEKEKIIEQLRENRAKYSTDLVRNLLNIDVFIRQVKTPKKNEEITVPDSKRRGETKEKETKTKEKKTKTTTHENSTEKKLEWAKERIETLEKLRRYLPKEFFINKKSICYPWSSTDVSLAEVLGKNVLHIDIAKDTVKRLQDSGYQAIYDDINTHTNTYDFVFDSRSQVKADAIDRLVKQDGYALIENAHAHANYFYRSPEYELIANISNGRKEYKEVEKDNPFSSGDTGYYLFKKKRVI